MTDPTIADVLGPKPTHTHSECHQVCPVAHYEHREKILRRFIANERLDEQQRTGKIHHKPFDRPLYFFQHDGSTCIPQDARIAQLIKEISS